MLLSYCSSLQKDILSNTSGWFIRKETSFHIMSVAEREEVLCVLNAAWDRMKQGLDVHLIPNDRCFMVYALLKAMNFEDVAGIRKGMPKDGTGSGPVVNIVFNADHFLTRTILTAMRFHSAIRCVACFRCSEKIVEIMKKMMFDIHYVQEDIHSQDKSILDFGVASCCSMGEVPDIIVTPGEGKKEEIVRLFGENPDDVVTSLFKISARINNNIS